MSLIKNLLTGMFVLTPVAVSGQELTLTPITQLDSSALDYITNNGSLVAQAGVNDPDQLIGRAVPCRTDAAGAYQLSSGFSFPLTVGTRYRAEASQTTEPLSVFVQGQVSGRIAIGPVSSDGAVNKLTRLDITESVRLSINTVEGNQPLGDTPTLQLFSLNSELSNPNTHWCIVTSVSVWNIRYQSFNRRGFNSSVSGIWIVSGNASYSRDASANVPYQVLTVGVTPYSKQWVATRASQIISSSGSLTTGVAPTVATEAVNPVVQPRVVDLRSLSGQIGSLSGNQ